MAFKLIARDIVQVPVKGVITDENGKPERFDFTLKCQRLDADTLAEQLKPENTDVSVKDFLWPLVQGWSGVLDEHGQPLAFDLNHLQALMTVPGLPGLCFAAYMAEVGAKAKN